MNKYNLPEDSDLFHLCYYEDEDMVDNLCQHQDIYFSSQHLDKQELESKPSEVVFLVSDILLFYFETRPISTKRIKMQQNLKKIC